MSSFAHALTQITPKNRNIKLSSPLKKSYFEQTMNSRVLDEFTFLNFLKQTADTMSLTFGAVLMPLLIFFVPV